MTPEILLQNCCTKNKNPIKLNQKINIEDIGNNKNDNRITKQKNSYQLYGKFLLYLTTVYIGYNNYN